MSELAKVIKNNPGCHIYYDDNGSWTIYKSKELFEAAQEADYEGSYEDVTLYEGADSDSLNGYASALVEALAELLDITVDSI